MKIVPENLQGERVGLEGVDRLTYGQDASTARDSTRGDFVGTRIMWVRLLRP